MKTTDSSRRGVPTLAEYLPTVVTASSLAKRERYGGRWRTACERLGDRRLDEIVASDIMALQQQAIASATGKKSSRGGRYAGEHTLRAMRAVFRMAASDGLIAKEDDPAAQVRLPRRLPSTRRALTAEEIAEINEAVPRGSRDAALDCLIVRLHLETACRRGGALRLRLEDLDTRWCLLRLREKGGTVRWQPISPTLAAALDAHARGRGASEGCDALLRRVNHRPIAAQHHDALWARIRGILPWAAELGVSSHWLRHTTVTWVERHYGYGVARAYAGHTDTRGATTATYIRGRLGEVAIALSALTGQGHPLARTARPVAELRRVEDPDW
jgi:integrase